MSASFLSVLRSGPPPPKVALLPDALFFTRALPVAAGASAAEAAAQLELGLEAVSPFPLAQLYYGWFRPAGADRAFVFAAYRRRFTSDQTADWAGAEVVLPASAALFGATVEPATTVVLTTPEGLTAVHWETPEVPASMVCVPLDPEVTEEDRARARDALLRSFEGSRHVIDLSAAPVADPAMDDHEIVFRAGELVSTLPAATVSALDVRDKGDLAALRRGHQRDVILWRFALGCAAALVLFGLGELALLGARSWNDVRLAKLRGRKSTVDSVIAADSLVHVVDELTNPAKRLLPLEMITAMTGLNNERRPADVQFTRAYTQPQSGINTIFVEVQTNNPAQIPVYQAQLKALPEFEDVKADLIPGQGGERASFKMEIVFKPGVLKPLPPI